MKIDNGNRIIDVDDNIDTNDTRPTDVPKISIERLEDSKTSYNIRKRGFGKFEYVFIFCAVLLLLCMGFIIWKNRYDMMNLEVPVSRSDSEVIEALKVPYKPTIKDTRKISDTILGVDMDLYPLSGLKASLEYELPDTTDKSLVLFMRSADYHPDSTPIGTLVVDGKLIKGKERKSRAAYLAISNEGKPEIGVSLSDKVPNFVEKSKGSFFRQFVLLSDGAIPRDFYLKGKVERAAIGILNGMLYYIITKNKESMYDFAEALREFGFTDAIYITGGNAYSFVRDNEGNSSSGDKLHEKMEKYKYNNPPVPFLVFRNK